MEFAPKTDKPIPLYAVHESDCDDWIAGLKPEQQTWAKAADFRGAAGAVVTFSDAKGNLSMAAIGMGGAKEQSRQRFILASGRSKLPAGVYDLQDGTTGEALDESALGWLLEGYRFDRYATNAGPKAQIVAPKGADAKRLQIIADGEALTRDLINTPASDMGPQQLEDAALDLAKRFGAKPAVTRGKDLLANNLPMIHTVGRAAAQEPRLIDMLWGKEGPRLTLVGKGVCFDTGGLNIKPSTSMGLMKKDMGGAATVLGLAHMIMALELPIQLRVLIPAVENSISADAFRPQDILTARNGLTVEINNTDAEGRLVLADALTLADEDHPDLIVSMATLTGAARVAVGPDLAPFYATQDSDANSVIAAASKVRDPVWRMPFWDPYETMIEPGIANLDNAPKGGMAGSITAALFLRRFVTQSPRYMHFDIYGWNPTAQPARPKGGVGQGARAILDALPQLLGL